MRSMSNPNFKLTLGLRVDRPVYPEDPLENPAITAIPLYDEMEILQTIMMVNGQMLPCILLRVLGSVGICTEIKA